MSPEGAYSSPTTATEGSEACDTEEGSRTRSGDLGNEHASERSRGVRAEQEREGDPEIATQIRAGEARNWAAERVGTERRAAGFGTGHFKRIVEEGPDRRASLVVV